MSAKISSKVMYKTDFEAKYYNFDFSKELEATESISTADVTAVPSGLTLGSEAISGQEVQVKISGGTANTKYLLTCEITNNVGELIEGSGYLEVTSS